MSGTATGLFKLLMPLVLMSAPASSMLTVAIPSPTTQELAAANKLVDGMQLLPRLHNDCALRLQVAKEAALRFATSNDSRKAADPEYVADVQMAVMPLITEELVDRIWTDVREDLSYKLAMARGNEESVRSIDPQSAAGWHVWYALRPWADQIARNALAANKAGGGAREVSVKSVC